MSRGGEHKEGGIIHSSDTIIPTTRESRSTEVDWEKLNLAKKEISQIYKLEKGNNLNAINFYQYPGMEWIRKFAISEDPNMLEIDYDFVLSQFNITIEMFSQVTLSKNIKLNGTKGKNRVKIEGCPMLSTELNEIRDLLQSHFEPYGDSYLYLAQQRLRKVKIWIQDLRY